MHRRIFLSAHGHEKHFSGQLKRLVLLVCALILYIPQDVRGCRPRPEPVGKFVALRPRAFTPRSYQTRSSVTSSRKDRIRFSGPVSAASAEAKLTGQVHGVSAAAFSDASAGASFGNVSSTGPWSDSRSRSAETRTSRWNKGLPGTPSGLPSATAPKGPGAVEWPVYVHRSG